MNVILKVAMDIHVWPKDPILFDIYETIVQFIVYIM